MAPELQAGDRLLIDTAAYRGRLPARGDVVVFVDPQAPARWLVKRVAGVGPGRFWATRNGLGAPVPSGPDPPPPPDSVEAVTLPEGTVYVVGNTIGRARDSRSFGPIALATLVGRAYRCYAPAGRRRDL
jgi:signal peptidase I